MRRAPSPLLTLLICSCASPPAPDVGARGAAGSIEVRHVVAWGLPAAGSLTVGTHVINAGAQADTLDGGAVADLAVMLHDVVAGRMEMRDHLEIPPGPPVVLGLGGAHLMVEDLPAEVWEAGELELTLIFRRAGTLTLRVPIVTYTEGIRELRR